jgi:prefoldin subunit 5
VSAIAKLTAMLGLDGSQFKAGIDGAKTQVEGFDQRFKRMGQSLQQGLAVGGVFAVLQNVSNAIKKLKEQSDKGSDNLLFSKQEIDRMAQGFERIDQAVTTAKATTGGWLGSLALGLQAASARLGAFFSGSSWAQADKIARDYVNTIAASVEQTNSLRASEEVRFKALERAHEQRLTDAQKLKELNEDAEKLTDAAAAKRREAAAAGGEKTSAGAQLLIEANNLDAEAITKRAAAGEMEKKLNKDLADSAAKLESTRETNRTKNLKGLDKQAEAERKLAELKENLAAFELQNPVTNDANANRRRQTEINNRMAEIEAQKAIVRDGAFELAEEQQKVADEIAQLQQRDEEQKDEQRRRALQAGATSALGGRGSIHAMGGWISGAQGLPALTDPGLSEQKKTNVTLEQIEKLLRTARQNRILETPAETP